MKKEYIKATATIYAVESTSVLAGSDQSLNYGGEYGDDVTLSSKQNDYDSFDDFDFEEEY